MNFSRSCCNDPDKFCYVYGEYILKGHKKSITDFVCKVHLAYFGVNLATKQAMGTTRCFKTCIEHLRM